MTETKGETKLRKRKSQGWLKEEKELEQDELLLLKKEAAECMNNTIDFNVEVAIDQPACSPSCAN